MDTLRCWWCGKSKQVPHFTCEFGFELAQEASKAGWFCEDDPSHARKLVFCSPYCRAAAHTKRGTYRVTSPYMQELKRRVEHCIKERKI